MQSNGEGLVFSIISDTIILIGHKRQLDEYRKPGRRSFNEPSQSTTP
jgi:hypothetical protein